MTIPLEKYVVVLAMLFVVFVISAALAVFKAVKMHRAKKEYKEKKEYFDSEDLVRDEGFSKTAIVSFEDKDLFLKLKEICAEYNYSVLAKVRLDQILSANSTLKGFRTLDDIATQYFADFVILGEDCLPIIVLDKRHSVINAVRSAGYTFVQTEKNITVELMNQIKEIIGGYNLQTGV